MICPNCEHEAISYWKFLNKGVFWGFKCQNCGIILKPYDSLWYKFFQFICIMFNAAIAVFLSEYLSNNNKFLRLPLLIILLAVTSSVTYYYLWKYWKIGKNAQE
jgi:hypothetical protein